MRTFVIGCNHHTAPVAIRERLAFDESQCVQAVQQFRQCFPEAEAVILSTCNRTELYFARPIHRSPTLAEAEQFLADHRQLKLHQFHQAIYAYEDAETVRHLFAVVCSLDSMVVGESGILNQAKTALELARQATGPAGMPRLDTLFQRAFGVAKEVQTQTGIVSGRLSVGGIAVDFARQIFAQFDDKTVLMIGAGEMGELTLQHLIDLKPKQVLVTNRTFARAQEIGQRLGATAKPFEELFELVCAADIVLTCTGSPEPIITRDRFAQLPQRRRYRPVLMIDFAVPRDIEPQVADLQGVFTYNIDDLQKVSETHVAERKAKISQAQALIDAAVIDYLHWQGQRDVGPAIAALSRHLDALAQGELTWLMPKLKNCSDEERQLIEQMTHRLIRKVMHEPSRTLHHKGQDGLGQIYAETMRTLFDLHGEE